MSIDTDRRYLKHHFPEIEDSSELPINYRFIQLFTGISTDKQGEAIPTSPDKKIIALEYKIPEINLYPVFHKPISKCFTIREANHEAK